MFQLISFVFFVIIFDASLLAMTSASCSRDYGSIDRCRNGVEIKYPFWSQNSFSYVFPSINYCGNYGLEIECRDEDEKAVMNISDHLYYVRYIDYVWKAISLVDVDAEGQECFHPKQNFSVSRPFSFASQQLQFYYNCSSYPDDKVDKQYERIPCLDNYYNSTVQLRSYVSRYSPGIQNLHCEEIVHTPNAGYFGGANYTESSKLGFNLYWNDSYCDNCWSSGGLCDYDNTTEVYWCDCGNGRTADELNGSFCEYIDGGMTIGLKVIIAVACGVVGLLLSILILYKKIFHLLNHLIFSRWQNGTKGLKNVEVLLESYGCLALKKYKYSDIMAMTKSFKYKLGQGGYGCVYKGTLRNDGHLVAVKILNESKGNGEEFINEVATIGRTNHVNVVSLLGFCIEGNKRALVYEFMPNGSLERFIYNEKTSTIGSTHLGWEKLYQIALGIAKGLEYLHCGCNTRILHFDIKPHNILLDKDFLPKISDFGLAKLCLTRDTIVSMVGARGTMGYIAPEISCRNLGGVSHKSDVYSYGMMVLEMIGGRKNLDVTVENMSGIYFPHWIYNQLKRDSKVEGLEVMKFEGVGGAILKDATAKKMIIVALWCIQTHPANRPSMTKVVEMLEGSDEELQMPPNPSLDPVSLPSSSSMKMLL